MQDNNHSDQTFFQPFVGPEFRVNPHPERNLASPTIGCDKHALMSATSCFASCRVWAFAALAALPCFAQLHPAAQAAGADSPRARTRAGSPDRPAPSRVDVAYGPHPRNVFDFWQAVSEKPVPLVIFIHGGGFVAGDKSQANAAGIRRCLAAGVSFMSINYRFLEHAPIQDILRDTARSVQFIRCHAKEFNVDPKRIVCFGGSAGAGSSLWIGAHDDLADPNSADPVLRQSTRIAAVGCLNGQATYDLPAWEKLVAPWNPAWLKRTNEMAEFYHFRNQDALTTPEGAKIRADCDMHGLLSRGDPPVFMACDQPEGEPRDRNHYLHHPRHVQAIKQRCGETGVECEVFLKAKNAGGNSGEALVRFLFRHLGIASP